MMRFVKADRLYFEPPHDVDQIDVGIIVDSRLSVFRRVFLDLFRRRIQRLIGGGID